MADGKKSFILYADILFTVEHLDDVLAGRLFKHILHYVNDFDPKISDYPIGSSDKEDEKSDKNEAKIDQNSILLKVAFEPIKRQLKRDLMEWYQEKFSRGASGTLGNIARWHPDIYKQIIDKQITIDDAVVKIKSLKSHGDKSDPEESERIANIAVNATATATANVTVNNTLTNRNIPMLATASSENPKKEAAEALGMEKVKQVANAVWKDRRWIEEICQGLSLSGPAELKKWMALFNASVAEDAVADFTEKRYKRMIRGWVLNQKERGIKLEDGVQKSLSAPLKKL